MTGKDLRGWMRWITLWVLLSLVTVPLTQMGALEAQAARVPAPVYAGHHSATAARYIRHPMHGPVFVPRAHPRQVGTPGTKTSPSTSVVADPYNDRIAIQVASDGTFNMGAFPDTTGGATADSWSLLYWWPSSPGTSFTSLRIDGNDSKYGSNAGTWVQAPQDTDASTNQSIWQNGDIKVTQTLQLAPNAQTGQDDAGRIAYTISNTGSTAHDVGMRVMLDTDVNSNDGAPFRVPGTGIVRNEIDFTGTSVPSDFQVYYDVTDSQHVASATLTGGDATPPDRLVIAGWPHLYNTLYDYTVDPSYAFSTGGGGDGAYAAYWNPGALAPGASRTYVTYYGLGQVTADLQPPLALGISGPAALAESSGQYSPNPFQVVATVDNNGTATATSTQLTLNLPQGLSLACCSTATQSIGDLAVGQEQQVTWNVQAAPQSSLTALTYSVTASASNAPSKTVSRQISIPAASLTGLPPSATPGGGSGTTKKTTCEASHTQPVNCATGDFWHTLDDLSIPGRGVPIDLAQTYNSQLAGQDSPLGFGWSNSYDMYLTTDGAGSFTVHEEGGSSVTFACSSGGCTAPSWLLGTLVQNSDGSYTFTRIQSQEHFFFAAPSGGTAGQLLKEVDRNGYTTSLSYSGGQLTTVTGPTEQTTTGPVGRTLTYTYNSSNRIAGITDSANRTVSFGYDSGGNLTDVTDINNGHWHFTYDANHLLLTMEDPRQYALHGALSSGPVTTNVYDGSARVTSQTDAMNRTTTLSYVANSDGTQTTTITDPNGNVETQLYQGTELLQDRRGVGTPQQATWKYTYDPNTFGITSVTDPNQRTSTATYDSRGNLLTNTDALNHETVYTYDGLNDPTSITDPNNVTTTLKYDADGNLLSMSKPLTSTGQTATTSFTYGDPAHPGDITAVTDPNSHTTAVAYDTYGDASKVTDAAGDSTTYSYNNIGQRTSAVSPRGNVSGGTPSAYTTTYSYNPFGDVLTVTDPLNHKTTHQYDADRNLTTTTDALNHTTSYSYDADNERAAETRADNSTLGYAYDGDGNRTAQTNGLNETTTYGYNPLDRLTSVTDPLNRVTSYTYDGTGNRTSLVDAMNRTTTYGYDAANRLISISYSGGTTPNVSYTYDAAGQRLSMTDGTGTGSYSYDSLNRLTQSTNGAGKGVGYAYDLSGNLTKITYPDNTSVTRVYDAVNRVTKVTDWLSHATSFAYDANSNLATQTYPNGTTANLTYDGADNITQIVDKSGNRSLWTFGYTRDSDNRLSTASDPISGSQHTYAYDSLSQMTGDSPSGSAATTWTYNADDGVASSMTDTSDTGWAYDAAGELTQFTNCSGSPCLINQQLALTYNNDGDRVAQTVKMEGGTPANFAYDQANRLTTWTNGTTSASYTYDGDGLRQSKTVAGTTEQFVWDVAEGTPLTLQDGTKKYVTGPSGLPLEQVNGSTVLYYYQDVRHEVA